VSQRRPLPRPRVEIRLAGSGGQGIILAGLILAEAAGLGEGRQVAMSQAYGPEARGGSSRAEVILSDRPIDYPLCLSPDVLIALSQEAADVYGSDLAPSGLMLVDRDLVETGGRDGVRALPFTAVARDRVGRATAANIVALGALAELTGLVGRRALEAALLRRAPAGSQELNRRALGQGVRLARELLRKSGPQTEPAATEDV
jgi:2-oxoglutarate ferredoxin oxidoreductase subunit gamma